MKDIERLAKYRFDLQMGIDFGSPWKYKRNLMDKIERVMKRLGFEGAPSVDDMLDWDPTA